MELKDELHCSFCSKSEGEVTLVVAGPFANICDVCVDEAYCLIEEAVFKTRNGETLH